MAELTAAMFKAHNLQELLQVERAHRETNKPPNRLRSLQELEDSKHILADHFGGEAGFYHGVASGKCMGVLGESGC